MEPVTLHEVLDDLSAEYRRIADMLHSLSAQQWAEESGAPGWTVTDVVVHLAQSEEGVAATISSPEGGWTTRDRPLDAVMHDQVKSENIGARAAFDRWTQATRESLVALRNAEPNTAVRWAAAPLRPKTLATTRLAEHWAHALDIAMPLGISFPDTDRLRHIAWLGHATLPYAFGLAGLETSPIYCELISPSAAIWTLGPRTAESSISGSAGAFCRVGAQRLTPTESGLVATGPRAAEALSVLRNYAA